MAPVVRVQCRPRARRDSPRDETTSQRCMALVAWNKPGQRASHDRTDSRERRRWTRAIIPRPYRPEALKNSGPPLLGGGWRGALKSTARKQNKVALPKRPARLIRPPSSALPLAARRTRSRQGLEPHTAADRSYCRSGRAFGASRGSAGPEKPAQPRGPPAFPMELRCTTDPPVKSGRRDSTAAFRDGDNFLADVIAAGRKISPFAIAHDGRRVHKRG
jgi:hypothetical protein